MVPCVEADRQWSREDGRENTERARPYGMLYYVYKKGQTPWQKSRWFRDYLTPAHQRWCQKREGVPSIEPTITSSPPEEACKEATAAATTGGFARTHLVHDRLEVLDKLDLTIAVVVHRFEHRLHLLGRQHVA